jgi:3-oxoacyl-[acyl-carrier-protein] synthase III
MGVQLSDIAYYLPEQVVTNEDLGAENPDWDMTLVEDKTGVARRHIAASDETALDLAFKACEKLFESNPEARERVDGIVFCTQSEDYIMPPNSCILHSWLGLPESVYAVDFNLACSGYVYGLAMVRGLIATGMASSVLLINADTYSKYIHPQDRSARVLFGDGAAVTLVEQSGDGADGDESGIVDIVCGTSGKNYERFMIPAGGNRTPASAQTREEETDKSGNVRSPENIRMDGLGILRFVNARVPEQVRNLLERNELSTGDVDLFVFHQASKMALDSLNRLLGVSEDRSFRNLREVGNTVSASIPIALKQALTEGSVKPGDLVLMSGFGVGLSWGSALVRV